MPKNIFIFNPDTDYALALGRKCYNPPARIARLREELQLTPVFIASPDDYIIVTHTFSPSSYSDKDALKNLEEKNVHILRLSQVPELFASGSSGWRLIPWGWNHTLRHSLLEAGIPETLLKSDEEIDRLRLLSHRRTTIPFQQHMQSRLPHLNIPVARELSSVEEAMEFLLKEKDVYFKAPWSSSGRGVLHATYKADAAVLKKIREWLGGFIRKQGSVMAEKAFVRKADFATEWWLSHGEASFIGLSLFNTSDDGRYLGNAPLSQEEISAGLSLLSPEWGHDITAAQKSALETIIASGYSGPVGIDMLIDANGHINPCVEINLRLTMGMISLRKPLPL